MTEAHINIEDIQSADATQKIKLIAVSGQLDESNVDEKAQEIYKIITDNPTNLNLVFDLAGLEYMNSKAIGYLTDWYGKVTQGGGKIVVANAKQNIADVMNVVGLTQLIPLFGTLDEAKFAVMNKA